MRKEENGRFNTSVPDLIAQTRAIMTHFLRHPALPLPWPHFVPTPERIDANLATLEKAFGAVSDNDDSTPASFTSFNRARIELKASMGKVARYVEMTVGDANGLRKWPGFDLSRHPGERRSPRGPKAAAKAMVDTRSE